MSRWFPILQNRNQRRSGSLQMRFPAGMGSLTFQVCFLESGLLLRRMAFPSDHRGDARRLSKIIIRQFGPFGDWQSLFF